MGSFSFLIALATLPLHSLPAQIGAVRYTITDLSGFSADGTAVAWIINRQGDLAGELAALSGDNTSFLCRNSALMSLQLAPSAAPDSIAYGLNDAGQVVGVSFTGSGPHSYLYNAGTVTDLHSTVSLGGSGSFAAGIDNAGDIVGASATGAGLDLTTRHSFLYKAGHLADLHPAVNFGGGWSEALGINNLGEIVGASQTADPDCYHGFLLKAGDSGAVDLHASVQRGGCSSRANSINSKDEIVGSAMSRNGDFRAFLYSAGQAADLNWLVPPDSGWVLQAATGINDDGQIVGFGRYLGQARAFLLTPASGAPDLPAPTVLTVPQVVGSQDQYVGQKIQVSGIVRLVPAYSRLPCPEGVQPCNPITAVAVFLQDPVDLTKQLLLYQGGEPYKCSYDIQGNYKCPPFTDHTSLVLEGIYSKGKQPAGIVGTASPAGGPTSPQVTFKDFYYLDLGSPSNTPAARRPVKRKPR